MTDSNAVESILTLKRIYNVPVARLWRAWTDEAELGKWYVAGSDHVVHFCAADVRVGGTYRVGFGPPGATPYVETGRYTEVVSLRRLAFEETVWFEDRRIHTHHTIVEFNDIGPKSQIILVSLGAESWRTGEGWTPALENLAKYVNSA